MRYLYSNAGQFVCFAGQFPCRENVLFFQGLRYKCNDSKQNCFSYLKYSSNLCCVDKLLVFYAMIYPLSKNTLEYTTVNEPSLSHSV